MYDLNSDATELTPLTDGLYGKTKYNSLLFTNSKSSNEYYIPLIKHIWYEISAYFWKLVVFILILIILNTMLRSLFKQDTNLVFSSSMNDDQNNNLNSNYLISNDEIEPNLIWIVTDLQLTQQSRYLDTLTKQGILLQNYHISYLPATTSMNRICSLISKYVDKLTDGDINNNNNNYFDKFISKQYQIHKLYDMDQFDEFSNYVDNQQQLFPFLIYIILDNQQSLNHFENKIQQIISHLKLKKNNQLWQNTLVLINSDSNAFSLLYGPRIPNKKRGIKSDLLFHSVDWMPTLLHFSEDQNENDNNNFDGFDLWETLIYNKISPRKEIPIQTNIKITSDINDIKI